MRTDWSFEEIVIKAITLPAVIAQGIIDFWSPPPFSAARQTAFPIPGCPSPGDCREYGCVETCSEATESIGAMAECDGHALAEPLTEWGLGLMGPDGVMRCGGTACDGGCCKGTAGEPPESSSLAASAAAEESPPHVSVGATARGEGPAGDSSIPPEPPAGRSTSVPETVTRVVLVHADSKYTEKWAESWDIHIQDDGRTLKLFPRKPTGPRYEHTPGFFETGHDMGGVTWATEFFEQHKGRR